MQIGVSGFDLESLGWRRGSEGLSKDDEEEVPTHLNTMNSCSFLGVSTDKLSIQYTGEALHGHDVGAVQSNCPAPTKRLVYYFEIFVRDAGQKGSISIGFTNERFKMRRQPGWEANSYGYHGDDGLLYHGQGKGDAFGPTFGTGDTVGGGINYASNELFFTKNGGFLGSVCKDVKGPLFPTIGVHSPREKVDVNFGQRRFVFDIEAFAAEERMKQQMAIEKVSLPLSISHWIVRSYLLHYGYQDTLTSFDIASKGTFPSSPIEHQNNGTIEVEEMYALSHRKLLRQEWYPQLVQDNTSTVRFLLHCQKFIELVRVGLLEEAVTYARAELARFFAMKPYEDLLQDCIALLAYEEPSKSSVGYLLDVAQREVAADAVNAMILSTNPNSKDSKNCLHSCLERLLRQLTACCLERRALNGDQGEVFNLHRVLLGEGSK
ncbi:ran-binding protein 10 isoform X2 [Amborella trichopoda]|uniref:ran-binding protein 10 isoform X2 n=1 Tax=Amborella trichopoda TaxID=13333 RepID=UPI0005D2DC32|nr:ran-binding protein 10 isoform X2 [Amborella trichopoda]|eukprot:XP_011628600.1 ran-binding protein 10 isoform X2 [Amborella trichopoda]